MEEFATQDSALAVAPESAPVETQEINETVNTSESVPEETVADAEEIIEDQGAKPSKAVKELIEQRKKRQQAEQELAYWKGIAAGKGYTPETPKAPAAPVVQEPVKPLAPSSEQFETWEEYEGAREEYLISMAQYRIQQQFAEQRKQEQEAQLQTQFLTKLNRAKASDPAISDIVAEVGSSITTEMGRIIKQSDLGLDIVRWLHRNPEDMRRIAGMPAYMAAKELGVIEGQLKATPKPAPPKKVSAAPEPIQTLTPTSSGTIDEDDLPIEEYHKRRTQAMYKR